MDFYRDIEKYTDKVALITDNGETITYKKLLGEADYLYNNVKDRSVLFLVCKNCIESVCAYIGALRNGLVPVMINSSVDKELYRNLYKSYKPRYVCAPKEWLYGLKIDMCKINTYRNYELYETSCSVDYELNHELALLLTTSGSTGSPKLVRQSYKNIVSNAQAIAEYLDIKDSDIAITTMPMSYTYCLSIINSHLLCGATVIMNEYSVIQREFWRLFKELKPTTFGGVPFIYEQLKALRFGRMDLSCLRYITQAGGKMSKELVEEFSEMCIDKGIKLIVMYGQTEATARMSYLPWEMVKEKAGSIGVAIPGGRFSLVDDEGNIIDQLNVEGELVYTGDNVTMGYAEGYADLGREDENKGILKTGDIAIVDEDGYYYIVGRKKRFLKMFGNRVNLDEIESILNKKQFDCVCYGQDDKLKIYTTQAGEEKRKEIKEYICNVLNFTSKSVEVVYIERIPRNESGKVMYSALG